MESLFKNSFHKYELNLTRNLCGGQAKIKRKRKKTYKKKKRKPIYEHHFNRRVQLAR
jgi:hypothetical protein